ncbi:MAG: ComF family protein [Mariprofundaceae bacterium]
MSEDLAPGPCGKCLRSPPFQTETTALFAYQGAVRDAILGWKLGGDDAAVHWLIQTSRQRLKSIFQSDDLLLPVPMPLSRMRKSGQHHAADLTRMIADIVGCEWEWQLLRRHGEQERQSALSGVARRKNLRKSFHLNSDYLQSIQLKKHVSGRIWVVDDILTSGATLHCASKALRSLQQPIYAFSLARTLHQK